MPDLTAEGHRAAEHVTHHTAYAAKVPNGATRLLPLPNVPGLRPKGWLLGAAAALGALAVAGASLLARRPMAAAGDRSGRA